MSQSIIQPYLFFNGRCEEAIEFYKNTVGAEVIMLMRFSESPEPVPAGRLAPGYENKVMHSSIRIGGSIVMASDGCGDGEPFGGFSLSLSVATAAEAERFFNALSAGGEITMPLGKTFWSESFGMLVDKFGLGWSVGVSENPQS